MLIRKRNSDPDKEYSIHTNFKISFVMCIKDYNYNRKQPRKNPVFSYKPLIIPLFANKPLYSNIPLFANEPLSSNKPPLLK